MRQKIIVFGSTVQDIFLQLQPGDLANSDEKTLQFAVGNKYEIESIHSACGGGGANMAVSLARLNNRVTLCSAVGMDDVGSFLISYLKKETIDTSLLSRSLSLCDKRSDFHSDFSVVFPSRSGNQTIFSYKGANTSLENISLVDVFDAFCIAPLHGEAMKNIVSLVEKNKQKSTLIFANPSIDQILDTKKNFHALLSYIDVLQCNYREAVLLTRRINEKRRHQAFLQQCKGLDSFFSIIHKYGVEIIIVTRGKDGVIISHNGVRHEFEMPLVNVKNTVGAGDAFGSTFLHGWLQTQSIEQSFAMAAKNVISVLQSSDAQSGLQRISNF